MDKGKNFKHNPLGTRFFVFDNKTCHVVVKNKEPNYASKNSSPYPHTERINHTHILDITGDPRPALAICTHIIIIIHSYTCFIDTNFIQH